LALTKNNPKYRGFPSFYRFPVAQTGDYSMQATAGLFHSWDSSLGPMAVVTYGYGLSGVLFAPAQERLRQRLAVDFPFAQQGASPLLLAAAEQLEEYLAGRRRSFSLELDLSAQTPFRRSVLQALAAVPYAETVSYAHLALLAGRPGAARAAGGAMAANPLPIILPCHRVVGSGGELVGYSGGDGLTSKSWLLDLERRHAVLK
jgi:methylated-DNA-[protein]-cysteine S-methyltransferase